jgi:hypothetical protein
MKNAVRLLYLVLPLTCAACIKGKEADPVILTPTEKMAGNWQLRAFTTDSSFSGTAPKFTDALAALPACRKDDVFQFGTDAILLLQEGAANCNPAGGKVAVLGYWKLLPGDTKLVMEDPDMPGGIDTLDLVSLTDSEMKLEGAVAFTLPGGGVTGGTVLRKTYSRKK